jgi:hypothetical protein
VHFARPFGIADGRMRVRLRRQRLQQQLDLGVRFP